MSYFCKLFLTGPQAKEAASWIFSGNMEQSVNKYVYDLESILNRKIILSKFIEQFIHVP